MHLSLSVRIAEGFLSKEVPVLPLAQVAQLARAAGYCALCMRASQLNVHSSPKDIQSAVQVLEATRMAVSMVTGNLDIVYNNDSGPNVLRNIQSHLELARQLGTSLIRVALRSPEDIPWAQRAADQAAEYGIRLAHQCHTQSLFETVQSIEDTLESINRPNFGLIYEPANMQLCGQEYAHDSISRLAPWIFNVYLQNQRLGEGDVCLQTWCRGEVQLQVVPVHAPGSLDFPAIFSSLERIGYSGYVTVHQSAVEGETPSQSAAQTADYLRTLAKFQPPALARDCDHSSLT
ncbi:MAG: sugar phosphate isomerase/epimerase [Pirellulaceae bacterium]|nr:sugar phosphate isomerase/epimerase [Pirellulaceae bacterium]